MAKLNYKFYSQNSTRYALLIRAKIKELINFYEIEFTSVMQSELQTWIDNYPNSNSFELKYAYRIEREGPIIRVWRCFPDGKEPVLFARIWKEASNE